MKRMKIGSAIVATLAIVAVLVMTGCPNNNGGGNGNGNGEPFVPFNLSSHLEGITVGETDHEVIFEGTGLVRAGDDAAVAFEVLADGIQVTVTPDWAGLDIQRAAFGLAAGDQIAIAGRMVTPGTGGNQMLLNINHAGWDPLDNWNPGVPAGQTFENTFTLTAANVTIINSADPPHIRIRTNGAGATFVITELTITRP